MEQGKPLWPSWPLLVGIGVELVIAVVALAMHIWLVAAGMFVAAIGSTWSYLMIKRQRAR